MYRCVSLRELHRSLRMSSVILSLENSISWLFMPVMESSFKTGAAQAVCAVVYCLVVVVVVVVVMEIVYNFAVTNFLSELLQ